MKSNQLVGGVVNKVKTVTADYTVTAKDQVIVVNSADPVIVTLPLALEVGKNYRVVQLGVGSVTVAGAVGVTVRFPSLLTTTVAARYSVIDIDVLSLNVAVVSGALMVD